MNYELIPIKLKYYRIKNGYSVEQVSELTGISYQQILRYEKGVNNIPLINFIELLKLYNVSDLDNILS